MAGFILAAIIFCTYVTAGTTPVNAAGTDYVNIINKVSTATAHIPLRYNLYGENPHAVLPNQHLVPLKRKAVFQYPFLRDSFFQQFCIIMFFLYLFMGCLYGFLQ